MGHFGKFIVACPRILTGDEFPSPGTAKTVVRSPHTMPRILRPTRRTLHCVTRQLVLNLMSFIVKTNKHLFKTVINSCKISSSLNKTINEFVCSASLYYGTKKCYNLTSKKQLLHNRSTISLHWRTGKF